jgi:shikimate dehydrogenase
LGVLGWPVSHSRSPQMQNAALRAAGLTGWRYQLLPVPPELFDETVRALPDVGFRGANVTIPHKQAALAVADEASDAARAIGAANTLLFEPDGRIVAGNTDAPALIDSLPFPADGKTTLVLGAGGSARAAVWSLLDAGAAEVRVWNRHPERARELAAELGGTPVAGTGPVADAERAPDAERVAEAGPADVLVNCTPVEPDGDSAWFERGPVNADDIGTFGCVIDFAYGDTETPLIRAAARLGVPCVDGLELLVRQGALSFERFTGTTAPLEEMQAAVRGRLSSRR